MNHRPAWAPDEVELEQPSVARMYDFFLGGSHNFAADRELAAKAMAVFPDAPHVVRANRAFLHRAVTYLCRAGIDQFLDLGSGIPTAGNVHEVSHAINPAARTVYVDSDPVAVAHSAALLADVPHATILHADLRDYESVLAGASGVGSVDFSRPIAVLLVSVLPFVPDEDDPAGIVATYRDTTVSGSYLALSHGTNDHRPAEVAKVEQIYSQASQPGTFRSKLQVRDLMVGYDLVPPGLVDIIDWRPDNPPGTPDPLGGDPNRYSMVAAVGIRP